MKSAAMDGHFLIFARMNANKSYAKCNPNSRSLILAIKGERKN